MSSHEAHGISGPQSSTTKGVDWSNELARGLEKFAWISPVSSLQQARQGDVLLSSSGNMRLLLSVQEQAKDARLTFLTRLESGKLRLESAMRSKIDKDRVTALIVRKSGNPLGLFREIAEALAAYKSVLHNVEVLLMSGQLGDTLREQVYRNRVDAEELITVHCGVSAVSGMIRTIGDVAPGGSYVPVGLQISKAQLPADEYIENALFYSSVEPTLRTALLSAAVIANTLQNAHNLVGIHHIVSGSNSTP